MLESLEARCLMSTSPVVRQGAVLRIGGTSGDDTISIAAGIDRFTVSVNGRQWLVRYRDVRLVRISAAAGDDRVLVSPKFNIRCNIEAGEGNDHVTGSSANDTIFGNDGNDSLFGNDGIDYFDAGTGDDQMEDRSRINVFHGGNGNDRVWLQPWIMHYFFDIENYSTFVPTHYNDEVQLMDRHGKWIFRVSMTGGWFDMHYGGPVLRDDGQYYLRMTTVPGGIGDEYLYSHELNVTIARSKGLNLVTNYADGIGLNDLDHHVTFPLVLPSKT